MVVMSCAEVRIMEAMIKKYENYFQTPLKKGMCLCIMEDGIIGINVQLTELSSSEIYDLSSYSNTISTDTMKERCTGNLVRL